MIDRARWHHAIALVATALPATWPSGDADAQVAGADRTITAGARDEPLPDRPRWRLFDLARTVRDGDEHLVERREPFVVTGILAVEDGPGGRVITLCQDAALCCAVHVTSCVELLLDPEAAIEPAAVNDGAWVAVFGRLRVLPTEPEAAPRRRGVVARPVVARTHLIETDRIVRAERLLSEGNVVEVLADTDATSIFARAIRESGLADRLGILAPITVLAPVDAAFARLDDTEMAALFDPANRVALQQFVLHHVLPERVSEVGLRSRDDVTTMLHDALPIELRNGRLRIGGARTVFEGQLATNGLVHLVTHVLPPPDLTAQGGSNEDAATPAETAAR